MDQRVESSEGKATLSACCNSRLISSCEKVVPAASRQKRAVDARRPSSMGVATKYSATFLAAFVAVFSKGKKMGFQQKCSPKGSALLVGGLTTQ